MSESKLKHKSPSRSIVDSAQQTTKSPRPSYNCPINRPNRSLKEASASSEDPCDH